ncbi:putative protein K02A2.6-like [Crotalus adamanteus]|uniref:Gypsy retrotransposon integrase-like protein 1 n=1 Tax=Crotalus adamanteus TaxID=8729 RepID=A0AAW1B075_CROAD
MKALARSHLWWPGLDKDIEAKVHACHLCQRSRPEMPQAPVHRWEETQSPWSRVHIDYAGPFQGQFFLVLVDSHSKWLEVVPVSSTTTAKTIQVLRGIFATHGLPDVIVSDNGPQFTSSEFQAFLQANLIRHATSAPFHPSTNGMAERMVRIAKDALKRLTYGDWHHRVTGPLSYEVALDNGRVLRRHIDQLRSRRDFSDETPGSFPGGEGDPLEQREGQGLLPISTEGATNGTSQVPGRCKAAWDQTGCRQSRAHAQVLAREK